MILFLTYWHAPVDLKMFVVEMHPSWKALISRLQFFFNVFHFFFLRTQKDSILNHLIRVVSIYIRGKERSCSKTECYYLKTEEIMNFIF